MRPRIYGSSDSQMVRSRTSPAPGTGTSACSMRTSDAFGSPTGREARTMRLADCGMMIFLRVVPAKAGTHNHRQLWFGKVSQRTFYISHTTVTEAMGPRLRGDDTELHPA